MMRLFSWLSVLAVGGVVLVAAPPPPDDGPITLASLHLQDFRTAAADDGVWSIAVKDDDPDSPDDDDSDDSPDAVVTTTPIVSDSTFEHETADASVIETPIQRAAELYALRAPPQ
jgi:hypothetical protein